MRCKKKLVYIITKSSWGGAQRYVYDLANYFCETYDVEIWCGENELNSPACLGRKAESAGICVRRISELGRNISAFQDLRVAKSLYQMISLHQPDIIHLNSTKAGLLAGIIGRICKVRQIVFTAHGLANFEDRPLWQTTLISLANRSIFALAHRVILISKMEYEYTKTWSENTKHALIYNGITKSATAPLRDIMENVPVPLRHKLTQPTTVKFCGIGELHKNKGLNYSLEAFHQLANEGKDFLYIHLGTGELKSFLTQETRRLKLEEHVYFYGFKENASAYLPHFDALVFPSVKEGLPYVVIEATFAGIPTFASRAGGIPELIDEGINGKLHDTKDTKELTEHLRDFMQNSRHLNRQLFSKNIENFSISKMAEKTKKVYES